MAILDPDHLLDQADILASTDVRGRPRQVDLRRAVSVAYYAVFHLVIAAAGDEFVGQAARGSREYGLVLRSIDHATIKTACLELAKSSPAAKYLSYIPEGGFGTHVQAFVAIFPDLQEARHAADYDTLRTYRTSIARGVIETARQGLAEWRGIPAIERKAFLYLLLFPPKR